MADEPTLPRMPTVSYDAHSGTFNNTKKRSRGDHAPSLFTNSSDPAVFSSDDDPSVDNYTQGRRKKRYVGTWFHQQPASSDSAFAEEPRALVVSKSKRTLERQFDSGVWLGSDGTDISEDLELPVLPNLPQLSQPAAQRKAPAVAAMSRAEQLARTRIQQCIDEGDENIDLSGMKLESLSNTTVASLSEFACIPVVTKGVPFEPREPELRLFLASNSLARVPGAVFDLQYLTVLSLRGNGLTELPPAVCRLQNLQTLNVSQNSLRYLPAELLDLLSSSPNLTDLHLHPNPFFRPERAPAPSPPSNDGEESSPPGGDEKTIRDRAWKKIINDDVMPRCSEIQTAHAARLVTRSPVQHSDGTGLICSSFKLPTSTDSLRSKKVPTEAIDSDPAPPAPDGSYLKAPLASLVARSSRVPTLLELSLRACYRTAQLEQLGSLLPEDSPAQLYAQLDRALAVREAGGMDCAACGRATMIVPRAAWLEWWEVVTLRGIPARTPPRHATGYQAESVTASYDEWAVPFIRRGCSWKCVPRKREGEVYWTGPQLMATGV